MTINFATIFSVLFSEGDPVQFEAVPQEGNADDPASSYCSWFATLVWKGKRPPVEPYAFDSPYTTVTAANSGSVQQVRPPSPGTRIHSKLNFISLSTELVTRILSILGDLPDLRSPKVSSPALQNLSAIGSFRLVVLCCEFTVRRCCISAKNGENSIFLQGNLPSQAAADS